MSVDMVKTILRHVDKMPPLPPTVAKVLQIANDPNSSAKDMDKVISLDPVLSTKVLRQVNSAYYGLRQKITRTSQAIAYLGMNNIKNMILTTAVLSKMKQEVQGHGFSIEKFWKHTVGCSVAARVIAKRARADKDMIEDCALAGLLHDIGKLMLINFYPKEYKEVVFFAKQNKVAIFAAERRVLRGEERMAVSAYGKTSSDMSTRIQLVDHCYVGQHLGLKWDFPSGLMDPITHHHFPWKCGVNTQKIAHVVHLANTYTKMHKMGFYDELIPTIQQSTWDALEMRETDLMDIKDEWKVELASAHEFLNMAM